jgi:hypothetical protein
MAISIHKEKAQETQGSGPIRPSRLVVHLDGHSKLSFQAKLPIKEQNELPNSGSYL